MRPRTLIVTTVRRIRVDENFSVDILLFREFHGDDMSRRWEMFAKLIRMVFEGKRVSTCFQIGKGGRVHGWTEDSECKKAVSVLVADTGIKPKEIDYWFTDFRSLRFANLLKLDTSDVHHAGGLFCGCEHLEKVLMPVTGLPSAIRTVFNLETEPSGRSR